MQVNVNLPKKMTTTQKAAILSMVIGVTTLLIYAAFVIAERGW